MRMAAPPGVGSQISGLPPTMTDFHSTVNRQGVDPYIHALNPQNIANIAPYLAYGMGPEHYFFMDPNYPGLADFPGTGNPPGVPNSAGTFQADPTGRRMGGVPEGAVANRLPPGSPMPTPLPGAEPLPVAAPGSIPLPTTGTPSQTPPIPADHFMTPGNTGASAVTQNYGSPFAMPQGEYGKDYIFQPYAPLPTGGGLPPGVGGVVDFSSPVPGGPPGPTDDTSPTPDKEDDSVGLTNRLMLTAMYGSNLGVDHTELAGSKQRQTYFTNLLLGDNTKSVAGVNGDSYKSNLLGDLDLDAKYDPENKDWQRLLTRINARANSGGGDGGG